jgi:hypothetical protein
MGRVFHRGGVVSFLVRDPTHRGKAAMNGAPGTRRVWIWVGGGLWIPPFTVRLRRMGQPIICSVSITLKEWLDGMGRANILQCITDL